MNEEEKERKILNIKRRDVLSTTLTLLLLLNMMAILPRTSASPTAQLKIEDARTGTTEIYFTTNEPPEGGYFTINISVYDIVGMAAWQVNITWDPTLFEIENKSTNADMYLPADNVFGGYADMTVPVITDSSAFWMVGIKLGAPFTSFTGSGRLCAVRFHVLKHPTKTETPLTCPIHIVIAGEYPIYTKLVDEDGDPILYNPFDGTYIYEWVPPVLPKPYFSVYPAVIQKGVPAGPTIIGTPKAFFQVDILINNIVNESMLTALQFAFKYPTNLFVLVPYSAELNASAGTFVNNTIWQPFGRDFWTVYGGETGGIEKQYVFWSINPNPDTGKFDWGVFPDSTGLPTSERVICTFYFEATVQEESPWEEYVSGAFNIDYVFPSLPEHMFLNADDEWIPAQPPVDGDYYIKGYVLGLLVDVYTQYPGEYGGRGINMTSDMFFPQATVHLYAEVTYNGDPVQNKPVTFQVFNEQGYVNFSKTAITDENGIAHIYFGIEWPCSGAEETIFGIWTVVASTQVRETQAWDWMWFKVNWLVHNLKVTAEDVKKGERCCFNITFETYRMQPIDVILHIVVMDDLMVPIGTASIRVTVGNPDLVWCESEPYERTLCVYIPKWAFAGEGEVEVSVLSDWPANGGVPYHPGASTTFTIKPYTA